MRLFNIIKEDSCLEDDVYIHLLFDCDKIEILFSDKNSFCCEAQNQLSLGQIRITQPVIHLLKTNKPEKINDKTLYGYIKLFESIKLGNYKNKDYSIPLDEFYKIDSDFKKINFSFMSNGWRGSLEDYFRKSTSSIIYYNYNKFGLYLLGSNGLEGHLSTRNDGKTLVSTRVGPIEDTSECSVSYIHLNQLVIYVINNFPCDFPQINNPITDLYNSGTVKMY